MMPTMMQTGTTTDTTMTHTLTLVSVGFDGTLSVGLSSSEMKEL